MSPRPYASSLFAATLLVAAALLLPIAGLRAQTADDVINAYLKARGGLQKIRSIQTERVSGTISFGPNLEGPFFVERKRTLKMHMELHVGGQTLIRVYDGKSAGWIYNPFTPSPAVAPMTGDDIRGISEEADFEGPFVDYKSKGNQIEYAGKEEIEGKQANKLKLTNKYGEVSYFFFDPSTGLILKWEGTRKNGDKDIRWQTFFRDFRDVNGLQYPFLVESGAVGSDQIQKIVATKIEVNISLDDASFGQPKAPAPPAPEEPAKPN